MGHLTDLRTPDRPEVQVGLCAGVTDFAHTYLI